MTMAMEWTEEQKKVITARGSNILVSAAAGSGKTAVLVERILGRVTDPVDPVDVDELLIVTFTRAAAGEMRERITQRLMDACAQDPKNAHLAEQTALIHHAKITTIDGFCSDVLREYGHTIDLTPGFRVAEEGEAALLRKDTLDALLEAAHGDEDEERLVRFRDFVETFATGKNENAVESLILKVYTSASSNPDPEGWLKNAASSMDIHSVGEMMDTPWMREILREAHGLVEEGLELSRYNTVLAEDVNGPSQYRPSAEADLAIFEALDASRDFDDTRKALFGMKQVALSRKKNPSADPAKTEEFKSARTDLNEILKELKNGIFAMDSQAVYEGVAGSRGPILVLLELVSEFMEEYGAAKRKKNIVDFSDLEHLTLQILRNENGERTFAAREYAARFREVMIDEYQDSNYLQEAILTAVSRAEDGDPNYFCVGDVKQSIYSFRQARPDLFMEKYHRFKAHPEEGVRIDLHRNFRSSRQVVDAVNGLFRQIMIPEVGGVSYDNDAALVAGARDLDRMGKKTELIAVCADEQLADGTNVLGGNRTGSKDSRVMEARAVGKRIQELVGHEELWDPKLNAMRKVEYRDIVILLRTVTGWGDVFAEELAAMHIPAYSPAKSGYFEALEVQVLLNYLKLLDNPQQDIPAVSVLKSGFLGLTADELARIRTADLTVSWSGSAKRDDISYYDAARAYEAKGPEDDLRAKLRTFFRQFDSFRDRVRDTPLHELIYAVLTETGYMEYCSVLPGGEQRALNLRMLIDRAADYETTSYIGLFNFIRYIDNLRKQSQDFGELSTLSESADVVRIYSIHKSKGLEYPIVFVSGMSKQFNMQDMNARVLVHPLMGAASDYIDLEKRVRIPTLTRFAVRSRLIRDAVGEELRVLYVALTRAKEKLVMTGVVPGEEKLADMELMLPPEEETLPENFICGCRTYMQWVYPAAVRLNERKRAEGGGDGEIEIRVVRPSDLIAEETVSGIRRAEVLAELRNLSEDTVYDSGMREAIRERFSFIYPWEESAHIPIEVGVSEIKRQALRGQADADAELSGTRAVEYYGEIVSGEEELAADIPQSGKTVPVQKKTNAGIEKEEFGSRSADSDFEETVPEFIRKQRAEEDISGRAPLSGSARGTAYHTVMENLDYTRLESLLGMGKAEDRDNQGASLLHDVNFSVLKAQIAEQIRSLTESGKLLPEEAEAVRAGDIAAFVKSDIGRRIFAASQEGTLRREQPFVLGMDAHRIRKEWPEGETVYVQGIVDAFWTETRPDGSKRLILLDYKTDRVRHMETLVKRYRIQLDIYAEALEKAAGLPVAEKLIWSFCLGKYIRL